MRAEPQRSTEFGCLCRSWILIRLQAVFVLHARDACHFMRMFQQTGTGRGNRGGGSIQIQKHGVRSHIILQLV